MQASLRLATLAAPALLALTPSFAQADHLRELEITADRLHHQTVEFARWLRYDVPPCSASPQLRQIAIDLYRASAELQECLLIFGGTPQEGAVIRHKLRRLERRHCAAVAEVQAVLATLPHPHAQRFRGHGRHFRGPAPAVRVNLGRGIEFQWGGGQQVGGPVHHGPHPQHLGQLRGSLRTLLARLRAMEGTLRHAQRLVGRCGF